MSNRVDFEVEVDGKTVKLAALKPSQAVRAAAELEYSKAWGKFAQTPGVLLESSLKDVVRKKGLWDDEKQARLDEIDKTLTENEAKLPDANGKVRTKGLKMADVRKAAIAMRIARAERVMLLTELTRLRSNTAEGLAENERFNYLVSQCVVHPETKKPYFSGVDDYRARGNDPDAIVAANKFAALYLDHDPDFDKRLVENQFLLKYKLCREDLSLTDPSGRLVDVEGNLVDEAGNRVVEGPPAERGEFDIDDDEWTAGSPVVVPPPSPGDTEGASMPDTIAAA